MATGVKSNTSNFQRSTDEGKSRTHRQERQRGLPSFPMNDFRVLFELYRGVCGYRNVIIEVDLSLFETISPRCR